MDSLREALDAAVTENEGTTDEQDNISAQAVESGQTAVEDGQVQAGAGQEDSSPDTGGPDASIQPTGVEEGGEQNAELQSGAAEVREGAQDADKNPLSGDSPKAPVDWGPKERENWSKVPRDIQARIVQREKDMAEAMANTKDARQTHDAFKQLSQSYAPIMAAEGVSDPMEAVKGLFDTVATLRMGTPQQKAQMVAQLIGNYGVDIQTLDSALAGEAPAAADPQQTQLQQMLDERLAPMNQLMEAINQAQTQQQTQTQENAQASVREFAKTAEFLNDVRQDMADLIDMAASRGQDMSLEDAYKKACMMNPEISAVLAQREQEANIRANAQTMANKNAAASSVVGRQGNPAAGKPQGDGSIRSSLLNAMDTLQDG